MERASISEQLNNLPEEIVQDLDYNICYCHRIKKIDIVKIILEGATTREEAIEKAGAGDAPGCCFLRIDDLIDKIEKWTS